MDSVFKQFLEYIFTHWAQFASMGGWLFYALERYYFIPKREAEREAQYRNDLSAWREAFNDLTDKTTETLSRLSTTLEVIKDRGER